MHCASSGPSLQRRRLPPLTCVSDAAQLQDEDFVKGLVGDLLGQLRATNINLPQAFVQIGMQGGPLVPGCAPARQHCGASEQACSCGSPPQASTGC